MVPVRQYGGARGDCAGVGVVAAGQQREGAVNGKIDLFLKIVLVIEISIVVLGLSGVLNVR